ncbi:MAG TPA: hypothetical protein VH394_25915 [Thermoanaerobaculia bacterium]|nr:hypothetical protein [Thermoanaerobaculia bacterium]
MIDTLPQTSSIALGLDIEETTGSSRSSRRTYGTYSSSLAVHVGEGIVIDIPLHESDAPAIRLNDAFKEAERVIAGLLKMPAGWDSYGAKPIDRQRAAAARYVVWMSIASGAPPPAIVPTSDGGIQLEWHRCGVDLEIRAVAETLLEISFEDLESGEIYEDEMIGADWAPLKSFFDRVSCYK